MELTHYEKIRGMTLKEELEILRGEPIKVFTGDPMSIPCIETSDPEKLCKHPVVSVSMITYNHEPYIRQAIEGVMMQKTDFEFELIIGEDCSQDKTREICFEYQKKYPDKIRVLWWHENVSKLGGNGRRCRARCRGEFVALCEGDDYWTDPLKLQKQVDFLRETDADFCVASCEWHYPDGRVKVDTYKQTKAILDKKDVLEHYFHTSTYLYKRASASSCRQKYAGIPLWYDTVFLACMAMEGKFCYIPDVVSVYNWTGGGMGGWIHGEKRVILTLTQYYSLAFWGPSDARLYYALRAVDKILATVARRTENGYFYSFGFRNRCIRLLFTVIRMIPCQQRLYVLLSLLQTLIVTQVYVTYSRCRILGVAWRSVKAMFKKIG